MSSRFVPDTSVLFIAYSFFNEASNSTVRCQMAGLLVNNVFQRKWESDRGLIWYYVPKFDWRDCGKPRKLSVVIADLRTGVLTRDFQIRKHMFYSLCCHLYPPSP